MSRNRASSRVLTVIALLTVLILASLPAQAEPGRHPATGVQAVAAFGESSLVRILNFFRSLWPQGMTKEGITIDPDGARNHLGTSVDPTGGLTDEGVTIDPNGRQ